MKTSILVCTLLLFSNLSFGQKMGEITYDISNPGNLLFHEYNPNEHPKFLIVALHGCTQSANSYAEQSGWNKIAEEYNCIVLYPEQKASNNLSMCFNWFLKNDAWGKGESLSIFEATEFIKAKYNIPANNTFITGVSAGAAMSVNILANFPSSYGHGAILAGGPYLHSKNVFSAMKSMQSPDELSAKEWLEKLPHSEITPPKLSIMYGNKDFVVDPLNSIELAKQWCAWNEIQMDSFKSSPFLERNDIHLTQYKNAIDETQIYLYQIDNIGHAVPVNPGGKSNEGGQEGPYAVDIDFFSTYYLAKDFGIIPE